MLEALRVGGNPSSVHRPGRAARARIEKARHQVAALVGARARDVLFTSGGTEANNLALRAFTSPDPSPGGVLVSAIEHESVLLAAPTARRIPVDGNGVIDLAALEQMLHGTAIPMAGGLVSVMLANNETGVIQPIAEIVRLAHAMGARVHCDAVQAVGKVAVDCHALGVDYLSLSGHKLGGPTGVGALIVREDAPFAADRIGGGQEAGRRAGTENVSGIAGLGAAAEVSLGGLGRAMEGVALRQRIEAALPGIVHGALAPRLPNTTCISMPGVPAETQVMALDLAGVAVSAGAACSSGKVSRSMVLTAMGVAAPVAETAIRISCGWTTEAEDVDRLIAAWQDLHIRVKYSDTDPAARQAA
jgi:cysteine desulfurase